MARKELWKQNCFFAGTCGNDFVCVCVSGRDVQMMMKERKREREMERNKQPINIKFAFSFLKQCSQQQFLSIFYGIFSLTHILWLAAGCCCIQFTFI